MHIKLQKQEKNSKISFRRAKLFKLSFIIGFHKWRKQVELELNIKINNTILKITRLN